MASIAHVGIDVHEGKFRVALLPESGTQFLDQCTLSSEPKRVLQYLGRWGRDYEMHCYYEAGALGYAPHRWLTQAGLECQVIAPSLTPRAPGDRVRTDARDARRLALQGRAGGLVAVHVPTPEEEAVRELVRCRLVQLRELTAARQRVQAWLLRHGVRAPEGKSWTQRYWQWLQRVVHEIPAEAPEAWTMETYLGAVRYQEQQLAAADREVAAWAQRPEYAPTVKKLGCFRGINTLSGMMIDTESGDFSRFPTAPQYASYWGLTGSEDSTGKSRRLGGITKCGCDHMRWLWIQIAWHYQYRPAVGVALAKRQESQPAEVVAHAWEAQRRLYRKFWRLKQRKSGGQAVTAVARELSCFVWGAMTM
jgi:transposase